LLATLFVGGCAPHAPPAAFATLRPAHALARGEPQAVVAIGTGATSVGWGEDGDGAAGLLAVGLGHGLDLSASTWFAGDNDHSDLAVWGASSALRWSSERVAVFAGVGVAGAERTRIVSDEPHRQDARVVGADVGAVVQVHPGAYFSLRHMRAYVVETSCTDADDCIPSTAYTMGALGSRGAMRFEFGVGPVSAGNESGGAVYLALAVDIGNAAGWHEWPAETPHARPRPADDDECDRWRREVAAERDKLRRMQLRNRAPMRCF
jgi:hypothetical protein